MYIWYGIVKFVEIITSGSGRCPGGIKSIVNIHRKKKSFFKNNIEVRTWRNCCWSKVMYTFFLLWIQIGQTPARETQFKDAVSFSVEIAIFCQIKKSNKVVNIFFKFSHVVILELTHNSKWFGWDSSLQKNILETNYIIKNI